VRVSVSERSAYDLFLSRTLKSAAIIRAPGIPASFDTFVREKLEALAGLKPRLVEEQARLPGSRILEGEVTSVQQSIGAPKGRAAAAQVLREFAAEVKRSGFVARAIEKHGIKGVRVAS
jgi:polar amino acid transport system substrate-binding protein